MRIKYTNELLTYMNLFAKVTGARLKDCFEEDGSMYFIVQEGEIGKALGKGGANIRKLQGALNRRLRIVEFSSSAPRFVQNLLHPLKPESVEESEDGSVVAIKSSDRSVRAQIIGRNAKSLNTLKLVAQRYFQINDLRVE